jgi:hypothetical protein
MLKKWWGRRFRLPPSFIRAFFSIGKTASESQALSNCLWKTIRSIFLDSSRISARSVVVRRRFSSSASVRSELFADEGDTNVTRGFSIVRSSDATPLPDLAQRARKALVALALLCAGVRRAARASPPFNPPLRPRATAALFFFMVLVFVTALLWSCLPITRDVHEVKSSVDIAVLHVIIQL